MRPRKRLGAHLRIRLQVCSVGLLVVGIITLLLPGAARSDGKIGSTARIKENLDLPYDAGGESEEEEDAPEIVAFYGDAYEASAVVFALDESGSMNDQGRWSLQSREVKRTVEEFTSRTEFGVVFYGSRVTAFRKHPVQASVNNKSAGLNFVSSRRPQGDTCIGEGVVKALEIVRKSSSKHRAVIVTSDGKPDNCATGNRATPAEVDRILQQTLNANPGRGVRVHTIFVGSPNEREGIQFMRRLADAHGGTFRLVTN